MGVFCTLWPWMILGYILRLLNGDVFGSLAANLANLAWPSMAHPGGGMIITKLHPDAWPMALQRKQRRSWHRMDVQSRLALQRKQRRSWHRMDIQSRLALQRKQRRSWQSPILSRLALQIRRAWQTRRSSEIWIWQVSCSVSVGMLMSAKHFVV